MLKLPLMFLKNVTLLFLSEDSGEWRRLSNPTRVFALIENQLEYFLERTCVEQGYHSCIASVTEAENWPL